MGASAPNRIVLVCIYIYILDVSWGLKPPTYSINSINTPVFPQFLSWGKPQLFRTQISPQFCLSFSVGGKPQLFRTQISAFSFSSVSQLEETSVVQNSALSTQLWGETSVLPQFLSWGETSVVQNSDLCTQLGGNLSFSVGGTPRLFRT